MKSAWRILLFVVAACGIAAGVPSLTAQLIPPVPTTPPEVSPAAPVTPDQNLEPWRVSDPHGPTTEAKIDVTEGTWMNLDVSPDGTEIVFDLLGDIYSMPITGGEAHNLTHGIQWDMQPTFSPDGETIAFTSDRSGGNNVWIMNRDGSNPRPVTKDRLRLVNSPAWTPDGEYIVARKQFTTTRSRGAGEIWLYHREGGDGLQMTRRADGENDAGEPAFSPDGRYVYFSRDTTSGKSFGHRDPNKQIYVIQRMNRETGAVDPFVTGPGGAVRPTPSPDGRYLAFVRRIRYKSTLDIVDLRSGRVTPLYDGLDRDLQETWAIHGVYPRMAWMPDGKSIVFWAGGKIRRIDIATKQATEIPFHVVDTRIISDALRSQQKVAPDTFDVKMLRWVQVSPRGDQVVYQALGHLWVKDLPDGEPRRLTSQNEDFEFYPSYSRDGKWIVYTTWNDQKLGTVSLTSSRGGDGSQLTVEPGHYVEPVFSPDGNHVVFRKIKGGVLRSPLWSYDPGIYVMSVKGGEARLVTKDGFAPQFGTTNDRLYYMKIGAGGARELHRVELSGSDDRTLYRSSAATDMRLSPDGKWLAFTAKLDAYVTPFAETGETIDIGPGKKSMPLAKLSKDASDSLHWDGDSERIYWARGPRLYWRDLEDVFPFVGDGSEPSSTGPGAGVDIGFESPEDVPMGSIALVGARIITMKGDEVIPEGTILVKGNRIVAVGPRRSVRVPSDAKTVDVTGKTIIPGLIDVHWRGTAGQDQLTPQQNWYFYSSLAFGVTTIFDSSEDAADNFAESELQKAGLIVAPRIFASEAIHGREKTPLEASIDNLDDARFHLRRMREGGAVAAVAYDLARRDHRQQIVEAARELGMMVVPEGGPLYGRDMTMIVDGYTGLQHAVPLAHLYADVQQLWRQSHVAYTPTLVVADGGVFGENYWYEKTNVWEDERLMAFVPREIVDARARRRMMIPYDEYNHIDVARDATALLREGVSVQLGSDGAREGLGAHWELWMLGQGGMTPMEALRCATLNGARYLGLDGDIGSLEVGKLADLVVLNSNPLEFLRNSEDILFTMVNGRLYDSMTMNEVGNRERPRKEFWFEQESGTLPANGATTAQRENGQR